MSDKYEEQLRRLVQAGMALRTTPIVDDDFIRVRDHFDTVLFASKAMLALADKEPRDG